MADVRLVDLEVIKRFSLAVRCDTAPAAEVLAALDASRATVLAAIDAPPAKPRTRAPRKAAPAATRKTAGATKVTRNAAPARRRASE